MLTTAKKGPTVKLSNSGSRTENLSVGGQSLRTTVTALRSITSVHLSLPVIRGLGTSAGSVANMKYGVVSPPDILVL